MRNRFVILVGSYNNAKWVDSNIESILQQDYPNYVVHYFVDASTDNTLELVNLKVKDNSKFNVISSPTRKYKTWFFANLDSNGINDNDIIVFLDGDDMLSSENVLSYLNELYNQSKCWITYGGMQVWDGNTLTEPYPQNTEIPLGIVNSKSYRKDTWRTSHLKTMRGFIWKKIDKNDLCPGGNYMVGPDDVAIMMAALELSLPNKIQRVLDPIYIYNASLENSGSRAYLDSKESKINHELNIRSRPPYDTVSFVTPTLVGDIGNQLFEIAVAASVAKDNNAVLMVTPNEHTLPNWENNMSSKIIIENSITPDNLYKNIGHKYEPIPYKKNLKLEGYFRSWKYFHNHKEYIRNLFTPHSYDEHQVNLKPDHITALHIHMDNYPMLPPDYFINAIKLSGTKDIVVFSDNISWCQDNLKIDGISFHYINSNSEWEDLMEISTYKNIIISNSSFGWWSAYLNKHTSPRIFTPHIWFGETLPDGFDIDDLILPEWTKV